MEMKTALPRKTGPAGPSIKLKQYLTTSPLFRGLAPELQGRLADMGRVFTVKKGQMLFMAGDPVDWVYYLMSGKLKEYYTTEAGEFCLRRILQPGSYISIHIMFCGREEYSYNCEAMGAATCFKWRTRELMTLIRQEPEISVQAAAILSNDIENSCRLQCLCRKTQAVQRVAGYLLRQCNPCYMNCHGGCPGAAHLPQANIRPLDHAAKDICLARETFSRTLSSLQQQKIIRMESGIVKIMDIDALKKISGTTD